MPAFAAERPLFYEGQYLGAEDLAAIVDYLRVQNARQNLGHHTWGIVVGLDIVSQEVSATAVEYYVQPGVAIDGYGRIIVVSSPALISADKFVSMGSGNVDVWIRYDQSEFSAVRAGFQVCATDDEYLRINETFALEVGSKTSIIDRQSGVIVNETLINDARLALNSVDPAAELLCDGSVPHQQLPVDDEDAYWLIPLGHVKWSAAANNFVALVDPAEKAALESGGGTKTAEQVYEALMAGRVKRRLVGTVAESLFAAEGVIRLRERTAQDDAACQETRIHTRDLKVCEGKLKPKELVWLEGDTRVEGDLRLLNGQLEFKDPEGRDYIERIIDGNLVTPITPLLLRRQDVNPKGGSDLQVLLGESEHGINRFTIGRIHYSGKDLCQPAISSQNAVVIQDNGRLGIGTVNPDHNLDSPYTVRGLKQTITENPGTDQQKQYDIFRLETFEAENGTQQWQMDLWNSADAARKSLNVTESGAAKTRLFLQAGGNIGVGTTEPKEQMHLRGDRPALLVDVNEASGLHTAELKFGSEGTVAYRLFWSKNTDKVYFNHRGIHTFIVDRHNIGFGTDSPRTTVHIASGTDVTLGDTTGYLLLGVTTGLNIVMDDNEIQARNNGAAATLTLQHEGGDFAVHPNNNSRFIVTNTGSVGLGTNSPSERLVLSHNAGRPRILFQQTASGTQSSSIGHGTTNSSDISLIGGNFGVGINNPSCALHVTGSLNGDASSISSHVACIDNTHTGDSADVLALRVGRTLPGTANNFITFFGDNNAVGRIEGNGLGGIQLQSMGADFAESLPLLKDALAVKPGDVVGVHHGKLSLNTDHADQVLVVSDSAVVIGNAVFDKDENKRATVAFVGQVKVRVRGPVASGDWLIASGLHDGTAIVARDFSQHGPVIGQAWESADKVGEHYVNCAVCLLTGAAFTKTTKASSATTTQRRISELEAQIASLTARLVALEA